MTRDSFKFFSKNKTRFGTKVYNYKMDDESDEEVDNAEFLIESSN